MSLQIITILQPPLLNFSRVRFFLAPFIMLLMLLMDTNFWGLLIFIAVRAGIHLLLRGE